MPTATTEYHYLEYIGGTSYKFWEVNRKGGNVEVRWGKIGSRGQTQNKSFASDYDAQRFVSDKLSEKLGKGYVDASATPAYEQPGAPPVSEEDMAAARARLEKALAKLEADV